MNNVITLDFGSGASGTIERGCSAIAMGIQSSRFVQPAFSGRFIH